jgi:DNA-binding beta-propeller fold protein YncE
LSGSPIAGPGVDESTLPPADRFADGIGVVDIATGKLARTLKSGQIETFDLSSGRVCVERRTAEMSVVDVATAGEIADAGGARAGGRDVRPGGHEVYVTSERDSEVAAIDTTGKVLAPRRRTAAVGVQRRRLDGVCRERNGGTIAVIDAVKR